MVTAEEEAAIRWATNLGIRASTGIRLETVVRLHQRYKDETDIEFVKKMCSSKTAVGDRERTYHEKLIKQHPDWLYEVDVPYGSIDFIDLENREIIEVKDIRSWKQVCTLFAYDMAFDCQTNFALYALFFGDVKNKNLRRQVEDCLPFIGIDVGYITDEDGTIERITRNGCFLKERTTQPFRPLTIEDLLGHPVSPRFNQMFGMPS